MEQRFAEKTAKVLFVSNSSGVRSLLSAALKAVGFEDVRGTGNLEDAIAVLEAEPIDWLITPLSKDEPVNAMQMLKLVTRSPVLFSLRVSLLLDEDELFCLPEAFSLGLLSWHPKGATKDVVSEGFGHFIQKMQEWQWSSCLTAAAYLRDHLHESHQHDKLLKLEQDLCELFPGSAKLLKELGRAEVLANDYAKAMATLQQSVLMASDIKEEVDQVLAMIPEKERGAAADGEGTRNALNISGCVLVDPDESSRTMLKAFFERMGVDGLEVFATAGSAWEYLKKNKEPQLILFEWVLPQIPGPMFLQRLRNHGFYSCPIVVLGSQIELDDLPIIKEMGVAHTMTRPLSEEQLLKDTVWIIQQYRLPTEPRMIEAKVRQYLMAGKKDLATSLKGTFMQHPDVPEARKKALEAEFCYNAGQYIMAKNLILEAIEELGVQVSLLNLLGKALMAVLNFEAALRCFEAAQELSPLNMERICNIAKTQIELGQTEEGQQAINQAKELDDEAEIVGETEAEIAILKGDGDSAKLLMEEMASLSNVLSYLNNRGIALTRCGKIDEGLAMYQQAMQALPESRKEEKAVVLYNLSLAHIRNQDYAAAKTFLDDLAKLSGTRVRDKGLSLRERVKNALKNNATLVLRAKSQSDVADESASKGDQPGEPFATILEQITESLQVARGALGCHKIFQPKAANAEVATMLQELPRFNSRQKIQKS